MVPYERSCSNTHGAAGCIHIHAARSIDWVGRDKHTQTKHLYAQLELYFTTLNGGSDTYTPMIL